MEKRGKRRFAAVCSLLALVILAGSVQAETLNCAPISHLPYTISNQGAYCLTGPLSTNALSGCAITINTNNVLLDLNGFKLGGLAAGPSTDTRGICALERRNITIRNGTVRGFLIGVSLIGSVGTQSSGHLVEQIRADFNTLYGIEVYGANSVIRDNQVFGTGGTTLYATAPQGIVLRWADGSQVINNMVNDTYFDATTLSQAIWFWESDNVMAIDNRINGAHIGIRFQNATGIYRGNTVINFGPTGAAYSDGTSAGGNYP